MHFKKNVKAGVLLYALVMLSLFSLLLQFYTGRVSASHKQVVEMSQAKTAYFLAVLTKDNMNKDCKDGQFKFNKGISSYQMLGNKVAVRVILKTGQSYSYHLTLDS